MAQISTQTINGWQWQSGFLVCDLLCHWKHGFFTRTYAPQLPDHLQSHLATKTAYRLKQVHGDRVISTSDILFHPVKEQFIDQLAVPLPEADGLYVSELNKNTDLANQAKIPASCSIWVCSADCVPILIGDRKSGAVAAIHAGWRGTASKILSQAIKQLQSRGSSVKDLVVVLGPAISGAAYQVSEEVANQVLQTVSVKVGVISDPEPDHVRLDIRLVQQQQLLELGFLPDQIAIAPYCTLNNPDLFFSYRRQTIEDKVANGLNKTSQPKTSKPRVTRIQWSGISAKYQAEL